MARKYRNLDLTEYDGCRAEKDFGMRPLGVGFLDGRDGYPTGDLAAELLQKLGRFCLPDYLVNCNRQRLPSPFTHEMVSIEVDGQTIELGHGEIRLIGAENIYAAPDLIVHYIAHQGYMPPPEFVAALKAAEPGSLEHRVYTKTLR